MTQSKATDIYAEMAAEARRLICEMASERLPCGYCGARPGQPCRHFPRNDSSTFDCYAHAGRWMEYMMTEENIDTPEIIAGAIQYVKCGFCGVVEGKDCVIKLYQGGAGTPLPDFAHVARRMEYVQWRDVFGPATRPLRLAEDVAEEKKFHVYVEKMRPCSKPRRHCSSCSQCECGAQLADHVGPAAEPMKKPSSNVDDLLG